MPGTDVGAARLPAPGVVGLAAVVWIAACAPPEPAPIKLATVARPPGLEQLDPVVREQFEGLWRNLREPPKSRETAQTGAAWGALGQWFHVYRYHDSAGDCYRNAWRLDPGQPRWPYYLGVLAESAGDLESARAHYASAAALAPEAAEPRIRLGDLALRRQDLAAAEAIYDQVLTAHPRSPGALLGIGRLALLRGDPAAAIELLEPLAEAQPEAFEVHYSLSLAWRQLGDEERAAEHLRQVPEDNFEQISLSLDAPWDLELRRLDRGSRIFTLRGVRAFRRGQHQLAAKLLGRAVAADPEGAEERLNYAVALLHAGRPAAAEDELHETLRLAGEGSELAARAHLELGRVLVAGRRFDDAARHLQTSLEIDPHSIAAHLELGRLYQRQERLEDALAHYAAVRAIDRPLAAVRFWHAALLTALGRPRAAVESLEEDLRRLGGDRQLTLLLARLLAAADAGPRDLARARELVAGRAEPPDVLFAETAAMVAAADGRFGDAVAWQRAAVAALDGLRPRAAVHTARRRLVLYQRGEPCRNPWEAQERLMTTAVVAP
jgi:tetratricopeptide (TPR) repeat protein